MTDPGVNGTLEELQEWYGYLKANIEVTVGVIRAGYITQRDDAAWRIQQKLKRRTTRAHNIAN